MENIFKTLQKLKIKTVALPAFGTGSFLCYPEEIVAVEMVRSIYLHAACSGVQLVNLIAFKKETRMFVSFFVYSIANIFHKEPFLRFLCLVLSLLITHF